MKFFNLKKLLFSLALVVLIQTDFITSINLSEETYSEEELIAPCSDRPSLMFCVN